jgi:hypothetical protein
MSGSQATAGIARHFEGWQLGLLAVGVAAGALWLGLPRPVEPDLLPLPEVDRAVIALARREESTRAREAERTRLPLPVRAVGELFRRHGACAAAQNARCAREAREDARQLAASVLREHGPAPLERLRAAQTELFLSAVRGLRAKATQSHELDELAGNFAQKGETMGWFDARGQLRLNEDELFVLFRVRWSELLGLLKNSELRPRLDEFRLYYRVQLEHPGGASARDQDERRLSHLSALAAIDGEFPRALAEAVLFARLGRSEQALTAISTHLAAHPDGPWALRAKNYQLALLARLPPRE